MSLNRINVSREKILEIVRENKTKHDQILQASIEGYWDDASDFLKKKEKEQVDQINKNHKEALKRLKKQRKESLKYVKESIKKDQELVAKKDKSKPFIYWNGKYPEDHGDDYDGTIRRLELSVDPEIELDTTEFDSYIRNKWAWKESFLSANSAYVTSYLSKASYAGTGSYAIGRVANAGLNSLSSSYASF